MKKGNHYEKAFSLGQRVRKAVVPVIPPQEIPRGERLQSHRSDDVHYYVTTDEGKVSEMFDLKKDAVVFKRVLKKARARHTVHIYRRTFVGSFLHEDVEVW